MTNPLLRLAARSILVGLAARLSALKVALPGVSWEEGLEAFTAAYVAAVTYSGIGVYTSVEPTVGKGAK